MERLKEPDIDHIMRRCISMVKRKPPKFFNFINMRKYWGSCNWSNIVITPQSNILGTGIHECLHHIFPNWSETQVLYAESRILNRAKKLDLAKFLKYLSLNIYKTERSKIVELSKTKRKRKPLKPKYLRKKKK